MNFVLRKVGNNTKANEEWLIDGDTVTLKLTSTFKNKTLVFKLGTEIDEETLDGRKVKVSRRFMMLFSNAYIFISKHIDVFYACPYAYVYRYIDR